MPQGDLDNKWRHHCGFCGKLGEVEADTAEEALEKLKELGWTWEKVFGMVCKKCSKDT